MNTKLESYSDMPISNTAATLYGLMRGVVPIGVNGALGRDQGDAVAGTQRQLIGEPASDRDALPLVETFQRCPA